MYAIVMFKDHNWPTIVQVDNIGYVYRLSTMNHVEWVCAATISTDGQISPTTDDKVARTSALNRTVIKPFLPGDPDPLARFRRSNDEGS